MRYLVSILTLINVGLLLVACGADATPTPPPPTPTTEAAKPTEKPAEEPTQKPTEPSTSQAQTSSSSNKLADTGWALDTLNSKPVLTDTIVTLDFGTDGKAAGTDGCNNYSAAYTVDGTTIKFEAPMAATM